jgi:hypothetical protein
METKIKRFFSWDKPVHEEVAKAIKKLDHRDLQIQFLTTQSQDERGAPRVLYEAYVIYTGPGYFG